MALCRHAFLMAVASLYQLHEHYIIQSISVMQGTPVYQALIDKRSTNLSIVDDDTRHAKVQYRTDQGSDRAYQRAKSRALEQVHRINRRSLRISAQQFDGIM